MKPIVSLLLLFSIWSIAEPVHAERFTLESSLERALEHNRMLKAAGHESEARQYEKKSMFGRFFPVVRAEVNAMLWDSDNTYSFDLSEYEQLFANMAGGGPFSLPPMSVDVRDNLTIKTQLMVIQPLAQLYQIYHGHSAKSAMAEAGELDVSNERRKLQLEVTQTFFAYLGALQMTESVEQALVQVAIFEKQTQDYLDAGLVEREALLKVQVQREELFKARAKTEKGVKLSRAMLNMYMGRPLQADIEAVGLKSGDPEAAISDNLENQQSIAMEQRPDLLSARKQKTAAQGAYKATFGKMLPELNLVGAYVNNHGMGDMMLENEFFGGLMLNWNVWEWGATYYEMKSAKARFDKAAEMIRAAEDGIRLEVEQKRLELEEAMQSYKAAEAKLELAKESLRLEQNRYEAQQASAADLVAAQTGELRASNDRTVASMQVEVARRALSLVQGRDLLFDEKPNQNTQSFQR